MRLPRLAEPVAGRRGAACPMPILGLQPCRQAHPVPFALVQLAVAVAVEARQQPVEIALPFTDHRTLRPFGIESLATATAAAEFAQRIERLAGMQALLGVAVKPLSADQGAEALQQSQGIDRCFAKSLPALLGQGSHLGAAWVDQAGIGGIAQAEWRLAGTFVDGAPGLLAATALFLDFDAVAPPQARLAGQGSLQRAFRALLEHPVEFDETLRRRTDPRGRYVAEQARPGKAVHELPAGPGAEPQAGGDEQPAQVEVHLSRTGP